MTRSSGTNERAKLLFANVAMVVICLLAIGISFAGPDLDRVRTVSRPMAWVLTGIWLALLLWTADQKRRPAFVLLILASATGLALAFWSLGYVGGAEAVVGGLAAALVGVVGPLGGR